jgi:hypothetical protein
MRMAMILLLSLGGTPQPPAAPPGIDLGAIHACHDRGAAALALAVAGPKSAISHAALGNCLADIARPPAGSGNWPIQLAAALHLAGLTDGADLLPWLQGQNGWYHNGAETGSPLYESANVATALELHHGSPEPRIRAAAGRWLRALWTRLALTVGPDPKAMEVCIGGRCQQRPRKERDWQYHGPWSYRPGERAVRNPGSGGWGVHWDVEPVQPVLGAALDVPRTFRGKRPIPSVEEVTLPTLLPWVLARHGVALGRENPPELFGLTPEERAALVAFVNAPSAVGARRLAPFVEGYGDPREMVIARFPHDALLVFWQGTSRNGNKPAATFVLRRPSGEAVYGVPSRWRAVGARAAWAEWDRRLGEIRGQSRDEVPATVFSLRGFGQPTLVLHLTAQGLVVEE